ncbi:hypothetical protein NQ317_004909 [Molorchus minor]|uniref:Fibronectin type-III domain-containing protein n=1 Tax=Molorchus minor TaxID=1323400 RepID=A0ABQ9JI90_9CUCU|nr:hypothetical protein NQ317_004909 [Molorchus minor]
MGDARPHHMLQTEEEVLDIVEDDPLTSTREIARPGIVNPQFQPAAPYAGVARQKMSYLIKNLKPATTYEARVQARNYHAWNKLSPVFHFTTRSNVLYRFGEHGRTLAQPAVYGVSQQGMSPFSSGVRDVISSAICLLLVFLIKFLSSL